MITRPSGITKTSPSSLNLRTFADHVTIGWPLQAKEQQVVLTDASGRILAHPVAQGNSVDLPMGNLAAGVYQVLVTLDGKRYAVRFAAGMH